MPTVYDNIEKNLTEGLHKVLQGAKRADFCVGYFNLRGWDKLESDVNKLTGENDEYCRLLIGMALQPKDTARYLYYGDYPRITQSQVPKIEERALRDFINQLTQGIPSNAQELCLKKLAHQLETGRLKVKLYTRYPLHAKLYIAHHKDDAVAFVGSSNLTLAGLKNNGELNIDVLEQDAADKLKQWFNKRWDDVWSMDVSQELYEIIHNSWAGGAKPPYHIYIKTAWHLSREAIDESNQYRLPHDLEQDMLEHQRRAVALTAQRLNRQNGVIIGDVVGLGKTLLATAVAKVFQEDRYHNVLIICPPALESMWEEHKHRYRLSARVLSLGKVRKLEEMERYHLIIIDESHNLRNRESIRHRCVRDYIHKNDSKVIMLTATPYNKAYEDIGGQLLLFNEADADLGIVPGMLIRKLGGTVQFNKQHPNTPVSSLSAFEKSEHIDDWRELMRLFMVRRTRTHIKRNYADYDEQRQRHYLTLTSGDKFYFPERQPKRLVFSLKGEDQEDQYAKLYSEHVVEAISGLRFPRYALKQYLTSDAPEGDEVIRNLSRAGRRLRGFACIGLFKRLESSGEAFLLSLRRHIIRNAAMIAAYHAGAIFVGDVLPTHMDEAGEEDDTLFLIQEDELLSEDEIDTAAHTWEDYQRLGRGTYAHIKNEENKFKWVNSSYLEEVLVYDLEADAETLLALLNIVPEWQAAADRKLIALEKLCKEAHAQEKLLIFTQYKDTAKYIHCHLSQGASDVSVVHGDSDYDVIKKEINKFSPRSNKASVQKETRVLVATDKLSEGVNLQDAHIIVNYDLPWAIIRLIQRAGRVDRIGQKADTVLCYSAMPEAGVDKIINLRDRLQKRMRQNEDLVGSDEVFFDDKAAAEVKQIYECSINLESDADDETDLVSRAHDIWQQAIKRDKKLERVIKDMPDVVYSAKAAKDDSVIAYIKDSRDHYMLAEINSDGEVISQSQYTLLDKLTCEPEEEAKEISDKHHRLVEAAVAYSRKVGHSLGGQLGGVRNIRRRVYERMQRLADERRDTLLPGSDELGKICQLVHDWPLKETAQNKLKRQMQTDIDDEGLVAMLLSLYHTNSLCAVPRHSGEEKPQPQIICSMGLVATGSAREGA